jgi:hypothetical protein
VRTIGFDDRASSKDGLMGMMDLLDPRTAF